MLDTFRHLRRIHALLVLLTTAQHLPLSRSEDRTLHRLIAVLSPSDMTPARAAALAGGSVPDRVHGFLRGLRHHVTVPQSAPRHPGQTPRP
ncbi:MAG: hypothetical protein HLUCCA08_12230 [Rhodobacteraceae bacterium HLUCCA08]|nr:MAG: hypothetical protein HLUCCA08_12230 [Rhodobacteraceae bacterium HLUCCA08]